MLLTPLLPSGHWATEVCTRTVTVWLTLSAANDVKVVSYPCAMPQKDLMCKIVIELSNTVGEKWWQMFIFKGHVTIKESFAYKGLLNCLEAMLRGVFKMCCTENGKNKQNVLSTGGAALEEDYLRRILFWIDKSLYVCHRTNHSLVIHFTSLIPPQSCRMSGRLQGRM